MGGPVPSPLGIVQSSFQRSFFDDLQGYGTPAITWLRGSFSTSVPSSGTSMPPATTRHEKGFLPQLSRRIRSNNLLDVSAGLWKHPDPGGN